MSSRHFPVDRRMHPFGYFFLPFHTQATRNLIEIGLGERAAGTQQNAIVSLFDSKFSARRPSA